jgi:hypothetical protein
MKLFIYQYTVHRPSAAPRLGIGAFGELDVRLLGSHFGGELTFEFFGECNLSLRLEERNQEEGADV